jgi:hypothetical protein
VDVTDATRRTIRTVIQTAVSIAVALPFIVRASGISTTLPGVGIALAVSAAVTRVMSVPAVESLLPTWLRTTARSRP